MRITAIKEGHTLRILDCCQPIAEGATLALYTEDELRPGNRLAPIEHLQLEGVFAEENEDWGSSLDPITLPEGGNI